ncbi:hypothetical protein KUTeg_000309 [Tegillarca granosa]|uniref:Uncharacterized protein n=1 Tax=Tegillarca granosa TaxID=220873 RepID=A0ABQ9G1I8_TEGGR|nr:hypothetical protein KUTeg_000309 [Tegillarca granosa]
MVRTVHDKIVLHTSKMEYIFDEDDDMSMQEYFKKYKDKLPDLVIVTGGHYGLTQYDDYANDQVIRFTTYSSQPRVIARDSSGAKSSVQLEYLNIPVDTQYKFRVVHGARQHIVKIVCNSDDTGTGASMDPDDPLIPKENVFHDKSTVPPPLPPPRQGSETAESAEDQLEPEDYEYVPPVPEHPTAKQEYKSSDVPPALPPRPNDLFDQPTYEVLPEAKAPYENDLPQGVDQMIDGAILQELEKDDFVNVFKFTTVEAIRLVKFIKTGHIPR